MQTTQRLLQLLRHPWHHINPRRRGQFGLLLALMFLALLEELVRTGAVSPFLAVLNATERVFECSTAQPFVQALGLTDPMQLLSPLAIAFGVAALTPDAMRLMLPCASTRQSCTTGANGSISICSGTLSSPGSSRGRRLGQKSIFPYEK